jgi:hypothetical protein
MHVACMEDDNASILAREDLAETIWKTLAQMEETES